MPNTEADCCISSADRLGSWRCRLSAARCLAHTAAMLLVFPSLGGADVYWAGAPGQAGVWSLPGNWTGGVPTDSANAHIANGGSVNIALPGAVCNKLYIGESGSGSVQLYGSGSLSVLEQYIGYSGKGTFAQSDGTINRGENWTALYLGYQSGSSGSYNLSGTGQLGAQDQYVGYSGTGQFFQPGGTSAVYSHLYIGYNAGSVGSYTLSDGGVLEARSSDLYVGYNGQGRFVQSGGKIYSGPESTPASRWIVGYGASGKYELSGTGVFAVSSLSVGSHAAGEFIQAGGTSTITSSLSIGTSSGGSGTYTLSENGQLSAYGGEHLGQEGQSTGTFNQSGGIHTLSSTPGGFYIGEGVGCSGTYNLSGTGSLVLGTQSTSTPMYVGYSGTGTFIQSGGTATLNNVLYLGYNAAGSGTYVLGGGKLSTVAEYIGCTSTSTALFQQTGGTNYAASISIGTRGQYRLNGGVLQINDSIINGGIVDGGNSPGTLVANCLLDLTTGTWTNLGATSVSMGANSLLIVPSGFDPSRDFAHYSSLGLTHTVGTTLTVPAGQGFSGSGSINDPVICQGTISVAKPSSNISINLNNGLVLSGKGTVNLGSLGAGTLTVNDSLSGMTGGSLTAYNVYVGKSRSGTFTQTGGAISVGFLYLGYNFGDNGTYSLSGTGILSDLAYGGTHSGGYQYVGYSGSGSFTQSGGTNRGVLYLGYNSQGQGSYTLEGSGDFRCTQYVGYSGTGVFTQSDGTNSGGSLILASQPGSRGTYYLNGGTLAAGGITKGSGTAAFYFNSGILKAQSTFSTNLPINLSTAGGNATVDTAGYTLTLSGAVSGPGNLMKVGSGTLVLSAANSYIGPTDVNAGTLSLTGSLSTIPLAVGGGAFSYAPTANGGKGNSQAVQGLTIKPGNSTINVSGGNTLALNEIAREIGGVIDFNSSTTGTITTIRGNSSGILGAWATYGSGTSMKYATASGSSVPYTIAPYTGGTPITSGLSGLNDITGTVNYTLSSGGGTLISTVMANTLQVTNAATTITTSSDKSLSLNGIMNVGSGTATITGGNLVVGNARELVFTGPGNTVVRSVVQDNPSGTSTLTMAGSGTLTLNGVNTYTGGTVLVNGSLGIGNAAALGTGPLMINGNITIDNTSGAAMTVAGNMAQSWNGSISFTGSKSLNLGSGPVTLLGSTTVSVGTNTLTVGGAVGGNASLTKAGSGAITLAGANTFSGGTNLSAGLINIDNSTALGSGTFTISGTSTINNTSGAPIKLINNNSQIWNADFTFAGSNSLNLGSGPVTLGANRRIAVYANTLTIGGPIGGEYSLTKDYPGALTLAGANTFSGSLCLSSGRLNIDNPAALGRGTFTISQVSTIDNTSGAAIKISNNNPQLWYAPFTFVGSNSLDLGGGPVTLNASPTVTVNDKTLTVGGPISGNYSLTKAGSGQFVLSGDSTYTGTTTISAGKLAINGSLAATSAVTVQNGGTLGGTGTVGDVTVNSGGHLAPGNSLGTLTLTGNLSLLPGALLDFELGEPTASDKITLSSSTLTLSGQQFADFLFTPQTGFGPGDYVLIDAKLIQGSLGTNGNGTIEGKIGDLPATIATIGNDVVLHVVPEPSSLALLGVSALGLLGGVWRKRRRGA